MRYLVLNFKTYPESSGANALKLAKDAARRVDGVECIVCPPLLQLEEIAKKTNATVFSQHCDCGEQGKSTGSVPLESLKEIGVAGSLLNHSERKVSLQYVKGVCEKAKKNSFKIVCCAASVAEGVSLAKFSPWAVAVEPPELIGTGRSVSSESPKIVVDAVKEIKAANKGVLVFVGAGVANAEDCRKCVELGADGVLLSSRFVFAQDHEEFVESCLKAMR